MFIYFVEYYYIKNMNILITSKQYPYWGGSATNAYKITKYLRNKKMNVLCLYFNNDNINVDPDNISGVFKATHNSKKRELKDNKSNKDILNKIKEYFKGEPDIVLAFNYYVPIISKNIFKKSIIIFMAIGCGALTMGERSCINNNISVSKFLKMDNFNNYITKKFYNLEKESIKYSDYIIIDHGELLSVVLKKIYPNYSHKFNNYIDYGYLVIKEDLLEIKKNNNKKEYDIICISSNWSRKVKNKELCFNILNKFNNKNNIIIGSNTDDFKEINNLNVLNYCNYNDVQKYLSKSKVLIITSLFESGPNTVLESINNNCQIVTSKNIGYKHILFDYNLCDDVYNIDEWISKINYILDNFNRLELPNIINHEKKLLHFLEGKKK
jgi:glycosyltransferase involved in cell wall biosynthesis